MKRKKVWSVICAGAMVLSLAACGQGGDGQVSSGGSEGSVSSEGSGQESSQAPEEGSTPSSGEGSQEPSSMRVAWWGGQERHNATIAALDSYGEAQGIEFSYEYTSWSSYFENLATQAVGSNLPDVIQMSTTDIINYSRNGQIIDLQPYVDDGTIDISNIGQEALGGGMVDGKLAGFTSGYNTVTVAYNKEIFDQAKVAYPEDDWTWSDFITTAKAVYDATGIQTEIPFLSEARWVVETMVRSYGYDFFSEDGKSLPWAGDEAVVAAVTGAIQDVYDGVKEGYFVDPEVQVAWSTTEDAYISQGKSAMSFMLSNYYTMYSQALGKEMGMVMLPKMDGGSSSGMYLNSNMYWCISANCQDPAAAARVLNYLINDETAARTIGTDRGISLSSAVRDMLKTSQDTDQLTSNTLEYVDRVSAVVQKTNPADPANSAEAISVLKNNYTAVMYGEMSAEDCVKDFLEQSAAILP